MAVLFVISVILVIAASVLAIAVSPLFFLALMVSLVIPALLTLRSYKSPNRQQATVEESVDPAAYRR